MFRFPFGWRKASRSKQSLLDTAPETPAAPKGQNPMPSQGIHIPPEKLTRRTALLHYAIASLMEELEAVDWYRQRADDTEDAELKAILLHNADEEVEHAAMILEWIRRREPRFNKELKEYLFTEGPITGLENKVTGKE
jgi:uncharacterized protein